MIGIASEGLGEAMKVAPFTRNLAVVLHAAIFLGRFSGN